MEPDKQVPNQPQAGSSAVSPKPVAPAPIESKAPTSMPQPASQPPQPSVPVAESTPPQSTVAPPVATAIGEIAAQPTVDSTATKTVSDVGEEQGQLSPLPADKHADSVAQPPVPAASTPAPGQSPDESKTIKLPVKTSFLPAIVIGVLIVFLLLAVVAYAFL